MPVYGSTQIYLLDVQGSKLIEVQATCRIWELRGFEVISVCPVAVHDNRSNGTEVNRWIITMRASSTLYVNWLMNDALYQAGPYDGQQEAEAAERNIIMIYGLDVVKDIYVTAQRDHERAFMGTPR